MGKFAEKPIYDVIIQATAIILLLSIIPAISVEVALWQARIESSGSVATFGVDATWDEEGTNPVEEVNWGEIEPGENISKSFYVLNNRTSTITLNLTTSDWIPPEAQDYITLEWDAESTSLGPSLSIYVTLTLRVDPNIEGITTFSFQIVITGK